MYIVVAYDMNCIQSNDLTIHTELWIDILCSCYVIICIQ